MSTEKKETKLKDKSTRIKRNRLQKKGRMYIDPTNLEAGFHYRVVNDEPGEVARRKLQGYEVVQSKDTEFGEGVTKSANLGSVVSVTVDKTLGTKGILMRMPNEDYQECLDELNEMNKEVSKSVKQRVLSESGIKESEVTGSINMDDRS